MFHGCLLLSDLTQCVWVVAMTTAAMHRATAYNQVATAEMGALFTLNNIQLNSKHGRLTLCNSTCTLYAIIEMHNIQKNSLM